MAGAWYLAMAIADDLRERTLRYALRIHAFCRQLPDRWDASELGKPPLRAGIGVTGNYWSACRGRSRKEFIARLGIAVDEAEETVLWLTLTTRGGVGDDTAAKSLLLEGKEILAILSKSHKTARENRQRS